MRRVYQMGVVGLLAVACGLPAGCGKDDDEPEYKHIRGRISEINIETGEVTVMWFSEKRGEHIPLKGKLDRGAEILIDGKTATLNDLLIDDEVVVVGTLRKKDGQKELLAKRVEVKREEGAATDTSPASAGSATQPGG